VNTYSKAPSRFLNIIELKPRPQHQFAEVTLSAEENPEAFILAAARVYCRYAGHVLARLGARCQFGNDGVRLIAHAPANR